MANHTQFNVEVISPEVILFRAPCQEVLIPGDAGLFGVLPGHAKLVSSLQTGVIEITVSASEKKRFFVMGGFAEVTNNECIILCDEAHNLETITLDQVKERVKLAERHVKEAIKTIDVLNAEKELEQAQSLLEVVAKKA